MASITIPYAVADFIEMRERGFYYVDKTQYIAKLEDYKAPVFLRPRRFGKSLLVSTLACYYDRIKRIGLKNCLVTRGLETIRQKNITVI